MTDTNAELDKILDARVRYALDVYQNKVTQHGMTGKEAKQAIATLLERKITEARLDEVKKFSNAGTHYGWGETLAVPTRYANDRIKQLQGGIDEE